MTTCNISYYVSAGTRGLQHLCPHRPVGLTRLSCHLEQWLPAYAVDRHRVLTFEYSGAADAAAQAVFELLAALGYSLHGLVLRIGAVQPVDWRSPGHYNILCLPADRQL